MYLLYSVNVYIFNVVIEIKLYSILFYSNPNNMATVIGGLLHITDDRTSKKALSICIKGCKMWNALSPDIKLSRNANAFKKMLKSSLLEDYKF